ncbi:hypothetical protein [Scytonema sp. NUACC26]|uniref:hypothetical protein n=1 Tax=Scytonema sp. NUACC26 TaxID=3140176 RepID=UPI0034DC8B6B
MQKIVRLTQGNDNSPVEACVVPLGTKHTEEFYENQGMFDLGPDEDYDNLIYFEFGL